MESKTLTPDERDDVRANLTLVERNALAMFPAPHVPTITADEIAHANRASTQMLLAMGAIGKPMYEGTVPGHVKARRRRQGKAARVARRASRH